VRLGMGVNGDTIGTGWLLTNVGPFDVACVLTRITAVRPL